MSAYLPLCDQPECTRQDHLVGYLRSQNAELANVVRSFLAFQNAGYLAGQPFEGTYAEICKHARTILET